MKHCSNNSKDYHQQQQQKPLQHQHIVLKHPLRILTVGDGDLTFSLALARCFSPQHMQVTASTLVSSREELCHTYRNCQDVLKELQQERQVDVYYGVDATKLHESCTWNNQQGQNLNDNKQWDAILFQHPHLGLLNHHHADASDCNNSNNNNNMEIFQAQRHHVLLSHYLASAKQCLLQKQQQQQLHCNESSGTSGAGGIVHVCLCGTQATTWRLIEAASRQGLVLLEQHPTELPLHLWNCWNDIIAMHHCDDQQQRQGTSDDNEDHSDHNPIVSMAKTKKTSSLSANDDPQLIHSSSSQSDDWKTILQPLEPQRHYSAPRRYRNGRYGSRHFLGKYGYRHRRTHGEQFIGNFTDMNVTGSFHYIFGLANNKQQPTTSHDEYDDDDTTTTINNNIANGTNTATECGGSNGVYHCQICDTSFPSEEALQRHLDAPALPDPIPLVKKQDNEGSCDGDNNDDDEEEYLVEERPKPATTGGEPTTNSESVQLIVPLVNREVSNASESSSSLVHYADDPNAWAYSFVVAANDEGMRMNQYLHQHIITAGGRLSKQQIKRIVNAHQVFLNQQLVKDKSRILHANDCIVVMKDDYTTVAATVETSKHNLPVANTIDIVREISSKDIIVVLKPRSMRAIGDFTPHTLERTFVRENPGTKYQCISRMDSGCPGLCVLQRKETVDTKLSTERVLSLTHIYTVLVHGHVPDQWSGDGITATLPTTRWWRNQRVKRLKATETVDSSDVVDEISDDDSTATPQQTNGMDENNQTSLSSPIQIVCLERTTQSNNVTPPLSTLSISTSCKGGGPCRRICSYLRGAGYPVVNDRQNQREYLTLPRSVRNRIKRKLCIGCYSVKIEFMDCDEQRHYISTSVIIPDLLRASYWMSFCDASAQIKNGSNILAASRVM